MARKLSRRKKTSYAIIAVGAGAGVAAIVLWPQIRKLFINPTVTAGQITVTSR